jgi:hypothetical protein
LCASIGAKIAHLIKRMGKLLGVWCKGAQCLSMGEIKQIMIRSLKSSFVVASLPLEYKEVL